MIDIELATCYTTAKFFRCRQTWRLASSDSRWGTNSGTGLSIVSEVPLDWLSGVTGEDVA